MSDANDMAQAIASGAGASDAHNALVAALAEAVVALQEISTCGRDGHILTVAELRHLADDVAHRVGPILRRYCQKTACGTGILAPSLDAYLGED